jgi:nucleoside-diphosphate-sugar epimerase
MSTPYSTLPEKKLGVLIGGSGLIGGTLLHYFKTRTPEIDILAPNSKKLSLREPDDIKRYFARYRPDFIINCAIAAIDSDPQLAFEINYLGSVNLARVALALGVPYIHFSSAAVMPDGENLTEEDLLPLTPDLANYPKSKLMAELTLRDLHERFGLDYTTVRLAVVYGEHDHKIQGFHRLFFSIASEAMPVMLTRRGVMHSYSNAKKLPFFVHHLLNHREEFGGRTYNLVDRNPVALAQLILTVKSYLELNIPREIYIPYPMAKMGKSWLQGVIRALTRIGIEAKMPAEIMFLEKFYHCQTLSSSRVDASSFIDPLPEATIFTELPALIQYYLTRWEHLNLVSAFNREFFDPKRHAGDFVSRPAALLDKVNHGRLNSIIDLPGSFDSPEAKG